MARKLSDLALTIDPFTQINDTQFGGGATLGSLYIPDSGNSISEPSTFKSSAKKIIDLPSLDISSNSQSIVDSSPSPTQSNTVEKASTSTGANPFLPPVIDFSIPKIPEIDTSIFPISTPEIAAPDLSGVVSTKVEVPTINAGIDFSAPVLPEIRVDNNLQLPDLTDVSNALLTFLKPPEISAPVALPSIEAPSLVNELKGPAQALSEFMSIGNALKGESNPLAGVTGNDIIAPVKSLIDNTLKDLSFETGISMGLMSDANIKQGGASQFGEVQVPGTNLVVDMSQQANKLFTDVTKGSVLEGVNANDVVAFASNPMQFVAQQGAQAAGEFISQMTGGAADGATSLLVDVLSGKDAGKVAEDAIKNVVTSNLGVVGGSIISDIINGKNADEIAGNVMTNVLVNMAGNALNAVIPGAGVLLSLVAPLLSNLFPVYGEVSEAKRQETNNISALSQNLTAKYILESSGVSNELINKASGKKNGYIDLATALRGPTYDHVLYTKDGKSIDNGAMYNRIQKQAESAVLSGDIYGAKVGSIYQDDIASKKAADVAAGKAIQDAKDAQIAKEAKFAGLSSIGGSSTFSGLGASLG